MAGSGRRPEHRGPPELFYDAAEARKYTQNSRMIEIQTQMSQRAVELLGLPEDQPCFLLDVGCGSGLSGDYISEEGHYWVGMDISSAMLDVAVEREVEGDLLLADVGHGIPFRPGTFDGCISISAVQWLCNADKKTHSPPKRLYRFFSTLYSALARGSRAVLQLYPENSEQLELITAQAMKAGFTGGMVVDYPNSAKAKKVLVPSVLMERNPGRPSLPMKEQGSKMPRGSLQRSLGTGFWRRRNAGGGRERKCGVIQNIPAESDALTSDAFGFPSSPSSVAGFALTLAQPLWTYPCTSNLSNLLAHVA
uniref:18S rRNA (guanine-N(7))-methyltransferase n=1 Tax=Crocodylus porosus TaxID=8502 RepID=A0A7M4FUT0_CROPO